MWCKWSRSSTKSLLFTPMLKIIFWQMVDFVNIVKTSAFFWFLFLWFDWSGVSGHLLLHLWYFDDLLLVKVLHKLTIGLKPLPFMDPSQCFLLLGFCGDTRVVIWEFSFCQSLFLSVKWPSLSERLIKEKKAFYNIGFGSQVLEDKEFSVTKIQ